MKNNKNIKSQKLFKNKLKKILIFSLILFMTLSMTLGIFSPQQAQALKITGATINFTLNSNTGSIDSNIVRGKGIEGQIFKSGKVPNLFKFEKENKLVPTGANIKKELEGFLEKEDKFNHFTFPGVQGNDYTGTNMDIMQSNKVSKELTTNINSAISLVSSTSSSKPKNDKELYELSAKIANILATGGGKFSWSTNGKTYNYIATVSGDKATISTNDSDIKPSKQVTVTWRVEKGYRSGDLKTYFEQQAGDGAKDVENDVQYLDFRSVVFMSGYNYYVLGKTANNSDGTEEDGGSQGKLTEIILDFFDDLETSITKALGLGTVTDYLFSMGNQSDYKWGLMKNSWYESSKGVNLVLTVVAWIIVLFGIVKNLGQRSVGAVNGVVKNNLQQYSLDLILCIVLISFNGLIFELLAQINESIINVFLYLNPNMLSYSNFIVGGGFGAIIVRLFMIGVNGYLNYLFLSRAIWCLVLYCIAPICISFMGLGGKFKGLYGSWLKEVISNIFSASIIALILTIFTANGSNLNTIESLMCTISIITITKLTQTSLLQLSSTGHDLATNMDNNFGKNYRQKAKGFAVGMGVGTGVAMSKKFKDYKAGKTESSFSVGDTAKIETNQDITKNSSSQTGSGGQEKSGSSSRGERYVNSMKSATDIKSKIAKDTTNEFKEDLTQNILKDKGLEDNKVNRESINKDIKTEMKKDDVKSNLYEKINNNFSNEDLVNNAKEQIVKEKDNSKVGKVVNSINDSKVGKIVKNIGSTPNKIRTNFEKMSVTNPTAHKNISSAINVAKTTGSIVGSGLKGGCFGWAMSGGQGNLGVSAMILATQQQKKTQKMNSYFNNKSREGNNKTSENNTDLNPINIVQQSNKRNNSSYKSTKDVERGNRQIEDFDDLMLDIEDF